MKIFEHNTYTPLTNCIVVYPCNIKNTQNKQIDGNLASKQYNNLINTLIEQGTKVHFLDLNGSSSQVFVRDIGFAIDDILFIANMTDPTRKSEIDGLVSLAKEYNVNYHIMKNNAEGGDILIHDDQVFIGQGNRTNERAVEEISSVLFDNNKKYELVKVFFEKSRIHLDCVFNILDKDTCLVSPELFNPEDVIKYFSKIIEVPRDDLSSIPSNIITPGNDVVLCSSKKFVDTLREKGYNSIFIEFSEIIKDNGSLGCCMLPLHRISF